MRRADRLFQIVLLLDRRRAVTAREIADSLNISERTVYRDIADLSRSGVPISGEAGVGYMLRAGYRLPPLMFDPEELMALALGSRMVKGWTDEALGRAAERALMRIEAVLPKSLREQPARDAFLVPDFHVPEKMVAPLGKLRQCIAESKKAKLDYTRLDGAVSARTIWPLGLVFWGESWTLAAWCELRGDFRTFRPDRMQGVAVLGDSFEGKGLLQKYMNLYSADQ